MRSTKSRREARPHQTTLPFVRVARPGKKLGRKKDPHSGVSHATRPRLTGATPVHVTLKISAGMPSLRCAREAAEIRTAFQRMHQRGGARVVHYSIQGDHMHLICEAEDQYVLANRMQGMKVSIAKRLNKLWGRKGTVFADRYHRQDLKTPKQVRNAIRYVLMNVFRHRSDRPSARETRIDPFSSGRAFDGWLEADLCRNRAPDDVESPRSWLLRTGWRRHGLLSIHERPRVLLA